MIPVRVICVSMGLLIFTDLIDNIKKQFTNQFIVWVLSVTNRIIRSQAVKYALVGIANTGVTTVVIFSLMSIGMNVYSSNISGYIIGIIFSFIVNVKFTFSVGFNSLKFFKFLSVCVICYIFNIISIKISLTIMPNELYIAQLIGISFYTVIGFFLNKFWSMK